MKERKTERNEDRQIIRKQMKRGKKQEKKT